MVSLADIFAARRTIQPYVYRTPLRRSFLFSEQLGADIYLKAENLQRTGSFKVRGAINRVSSLTDEEKARGTVAASSGNFAIGAAYAVHLAGGVALRLFMAERTPRSKIDKLREYDVEIELVGEDYEEAHDASVAYQKRHGKVYLHTFDDPHVIAGQGTVGLEIMEDLPDVDTVLVPIGGGGLISGVAVAVKAVNHAIQVVGVQVSASPSAYLSLKEGRVYEHYKSRPTLAEGLAGGFGMLPYQTAAHLIDDVILVDDDDILAGIGVLLEKEQLVVEASGVVGVSALLAGKYDCKGRKVAVILSGGNIDVGLLQRVAQKLPRPGTPSGPQ